MTAILESLFFFFFFFSMNAIPSSSVHMSQRFGSEYVWLSSKRPLNNEALECNADIYRKQLSIETPNRSPPDGDDKAVIMNKIICFV